MIADLWRDLRLAFRTLRRTPSVSVPAILALALGIGAATALYAVVYAMWLRPLPYPDSARLVAVTTYFPSLKLDALASPDYGTWQGTRSLGPLAAYSVGETALITETDTVPAGCARVSGNLLGVLGVPAVIGRAILPADDSPAAPRVAIVSEALWRERFGADRDIARRSARIEGQLYTIVGVLPRGFRMPDERRVDIMVPLALGEDWLRHSGGGMKILTGVARLQPGATLREARAELATRLDASRAQEPKFYGRDVSVRVVPLHQFVVREARTVSLVLLWAVASILLIASANVASLLVARAAGRAREMKIRVALGAGAAQIMRHLFVEGLTLGFAGIALGLALARALVTIAPVPGAAINRTVLASAIAAGMLCALAFSLAPALPVGRLRLRRGLVMVEMALSLLLSATAVLFLQNLAALHSVVPGFRTDGIEIASLSLKGTRFADRPEELRRELAERLRGQIGIVSLAFADELPPEGAGRITTFTRADRPLPEPFHRGDNVVVRRVDPAFFETMGIPLRTDRVFSETDGGLVAVVNRSLADRYFPGESPVGKQIDGAGVPWKTVLGVVADTRNDGLRNAPRPEIYLPLDSANAHGGGITQQSSLSLVIRTAGDPHVIISIVREQLRGIDRALLPEFTTMDARWRELESGPRFQATVFTAFAVLALLLACTGIYGVLSHLVALRRKEIGIRIALGALPSDVHLLVFREALALAVPGALAGIAGALAGARLIKSLLFNVNPEDPLTLIATAALLVALAIAASVIPAWRASHQDPALTLRSE